MTKLHVHTVLTDMEQSLFDALAATANKDVPIVKLFRSCYDTYDNKLTRRDMQQRLGPTIARINAKMLNGRIVPGLLKGTYRLKVEV